MEDRNALIQQAVARLQKIKTIEDFKAARQEILDFMEKILLSSIDQLKTLLETMFSLSEEDRQAAAVRIQSDDYLFSPEVSRELERIDAIPGTGAYGEEFVAAMEKHIGPRMEEAAEQVGKIMEAFMGGLAQGMASAMGATAQEEEKEQEEEPLVFDDNNPDTPAILYQLYAARSLEDLEAEKESLIESMREELSYDISELETLTDPVFIDSLRENDTKERVAKIRHRMARIGPEMRKEFARLAALPGAAEAVKKIKKEINEQLEDTFRPLNGLLVKVGREERRLASQ